MEINLGGEQSRPEPWPPAIADNNLPFSQTTFDLRGGGQVSLGEGKEEQRINLEAPEDARAKATSHGRQFICLFFRPLAI